MRAYLIGSLRRLESEVARYFDPGAAFRSRAIRRAASHFLTPVAGPVQIGNVGQRSRSLF